MNVPTSPVQQLQLLPDFSIDVKRDDLLHAEVSGNKWRKLKYNIVKAQQAGYDTFLTFGGAFSNHIAATAACARLNGMKSIGIIRGTHVDEGNATLNAARKNGMVLIPVSVEEYAERNNYHYHDQLRLAYPTAHIVPEGGANEEGIHGCMEIMSELEKKYDYIVCAVGTGTTAAGLILAKPLATKVLCVSVFKHATGVYDMIAKKLGTVLNNQEVLNEYSNDYEVVDGYGFGGYAKVTDELRAFAKEMFKQHQLPLDLVYTTKTMFALKNMVINGQIPKTARVLFYHSGGLQGNKGLNFELP